MKKDYPKGWVGLAVLRKILEKVQNIHLLLVTSGTCFYLCIPTAKSGWLFRLDTGFSKAAKKFLRNFIAVKITIHMRRQ